jgi:hypothetical protein
MDEYFKNIDLQIPKLPDGLLCEDPTMLIGEGSSLSWQLIDLDLYIKKMILAIHRDEIGSWVGRRYQEDEVVGTSEGVFWKLKCISPMTIIVLDILHTM